jgi:hypothetical protein
MVDRVNPGAVRPYTATAVESRPTAGADRTDEAQAGKARSADARETAQPQRLEGRQVADRGAMPETPQAGSYDPDFEKSLGALSTLEKEVNDLMKSLDGGSMAAMAKFQALSQKLNQMFSMLTERTKGRGDCVMQALRNSH